MRALRLCLSTCCVAAALMQAARADLTLSAYADVYRPQYDASYVATFEINGQKYADVLFRSVNSYVRAECGSPNDYASVTWEIMVGYEEGNSGVALVRGTIIQFDGNGVWQRTPDISGSCYVSLGDKHAVASAEVFVPGTTNRAFDTDTNPFHVITQQQGGGGGGA